MGVATSKQASGVAAVLVADETRKDIAEIESLAQFWKAGLLGDDELQKAVATLLGTDVATGAILWDYICDSVPVPRD
jgi:hypothetical protein